MINNSNNNSDISHDGLFNTLSSPVFGRMDMSIESEVKVLSKLKCPMSDIPLNKHFKFIATIGKGAYGSVYLVKNTIMQHKESPPYAIKVLKDPGDDDQI